MSPLAGRLRRVPHERPVVTLLASVLVCELVGASGSVFTAAGTATWYPTLVRPALAPPEWVFAPVWTTLFALLGVVGWLVWRGLAGPRPRAARIALATFAGQYALNLAWSAAFFGGRSIVAGLVVIALLWVAIVVTAWAIARVDRRAAALFVPYLGWVSFAAYLNYAFWVLN